MAWAFAAMEKGEKMSKYIEAVSAATIIAEKHGIPIAELVDTFAEIPDADVVPVRHGRWVHDHYEKCTEQFEIVKCSNCGIKMYAIALSVKDANYCRNCGAKMDGDTP